MASIERTASPRFKRAVPVRELHEAFTPTADEVAWAREQTRTAEHLLALVVLLKSRHRAWLESLGAADRWLAGVPPSKVGCSQGTAETGNRRVAGPVVGAGLGYWPARRWST